MKPLDFGITDVASCNQRIQPNTFFPLLASPRHPLMYFMVQSTITRLLTVTDTINYYIPQVTGPGATKHAVAKSIGLEYPKYGEYSDMHGRNISIIGNQKTARRSRYVSRKGFDEANTDAAEKMNMTHYNDKSKIPGYDLPRQSCVAAMLERLNSSSYF